MQRVAKLRHLLIQPRKVEDLSETPQAPKSLNRISAQTAKPFGVKQRIPVWVEKALGVPPSRRPPVAAERSGKGQEGAGRSGRRRHKKRLRVLAAEVNNETRSRLSVGPEMFYYRPGVWK